jgi:protein-disulfide isomerase
VKQALAKAGLNPTILETLPANPEAAQWVKRNLLLGQKMSVTGTPTIFINGRRLDGMVPYNIFSELVERSLTLPRK